jgi:hypothetical protein
MVLRRQFVRFWELWVLMLGHGFASLFLSNLAAGLKDIHEPSVRALAQAGHRLFTLGDHLPLRVGMLLLLLVLALLVSRGRSIRLACDLLGTVLTLRCVVEFLLLNLLLLAPLESGGLLLLQLIVYLPLVTLNFGWIYWRLDSGARRQGRSHIRFDDGTAHSFDYFHIAANALLQFDPSGAKPLTRSMKSLFVLHGLVMMDLVALTLSRAIGLASAR